EGNGGGSDGQTRPQPDRTERSGGNIDDFDPEEFRGVGSQADFGEDLRIADRWSADRHPDIGTDQRHPDPATERTLDRDPDRRPRTFHEIGIPRTGQGTIEGDARPTVTGSSPVRFTVDNRSTTLPAYMKPGLFPESHRRATRSGP